MRTFCAVLLAGCMMILAGSAARAQAVQVCDLFGAGYFYIPGTATCVNANTGATRTVTATGTIPGVTAQQQQILDNAAQIRRNTEGIALGLALPTAIVDPGKSFGAALNVGAFDGALAVGVAGAYRPTDGLTLNGALGYGLGEGSLGGKAGVNISW